MNKTAQILVFLCVAVAALSAGRVDNEVKMSKYEKFSMAKENKPDCMKSSDGLGCACNVCKDVVTFSKMMIMDHVPTEEQVLDKVCLRIFGGDKKKEQLCESIVKTELTDIIKYVKNRMDPKKCCAKFC